jgi:hypothetical protein
MLRERQTTQQIMTALYPHFCFNKHYPFNYLSDSVTYKISATK